MPSFFFRDCTMYQDTKLPDGTPFTLIVPHRDELRLRDRCFRPSMKKAGNFLSWRNTWEIFRDEWVRHEFLDEIATIYQREDWGTLSVTVPCRKMIGWEWTDDVMKYMNSREQFETTIETFCPNKHSVAFRIRSSRQDILAPQTNLLTIIYRILKDDTGHLKVFVHYLHPGKDIGELDGNVTERERRIFFDWDHPGEPIAQIK